MKKIALLIACFSIVVVSFLYLNNMNQNSEKIFYYKTLEKPSSVDPMLHDFQSHHEAFKSVQATLVSQHLLDGSGFTGVLAKTWSISTDQLVWKFVLRDGLTFESGKPIGTKEVIKSLTRVLYLQKQRSSHSELLRYLKGTDQIMSPGSEFEGIKFYDDFSFEMHLKRPFPKLLDQISFGLYAIVDSDDYDSVTGVWRDAKKLNESGFYKITKWTDEGLELRLREGAEITKILTSPVKAWVMSHKEDFLPRVDLREQYSFIGERYSGLTLKRGVPNLILYYRIHVWNYVNSPLKDVSVRRSLRNVLYEQMRKEGIDFKSSFFPTHMRFVEEMSSNEINATMLKRTKIRVNLSFGFLKSFGSRLKTCFLNLREIGVDVQELTDIKDPGDPNYDWLNPNNDYYPYDGGMFYTGILIEDPRSDIEFMFKSKEGIRLPDTDGRILKELEKEDFSVQKINELLWDQAVIWPIGHFSLDMWHSPELDLDNYNYQKPAMELQWIRQK